MIRDERCLCFVETLVSCHVQSICCELAIVVWAGVQVVVYIQAGLLCRIGPNCSVSHSCRQIVAIYQLSLDRNVYIHNFVPSCPTIVHVCCSDGVIDFKFDQFDWAKCKFPKREEDRQAQDRTGT